MMKIKIWFLTYLLIAPFFASAQITQGLVLHMDFNGDASDLSGSGNDGIVMNAVPTPDRNGNIDSAFYFNGTASIILPDTGSIKPDLPLTLSLFVKADSFNITRPLYHSDHLSSDYAGFFVNLTTDGKIMAHIGGNLGTNGPNNRRSFLSNNTISANQWHHVVVIINAYDSMEIYIDCELSQGVYSGNGSTNMIYTDSTGRIGEGGPNSSFPQGYFLKGSLDEVMLWNRALSQNEVLQICKDASTRIETIENYHVNIYPNPAQDQIHIEIDRLPIKGEISCIIIDHLGRAVKSEKIVSDQLSINTQNLSTGIYHVMLYRDDVPFSSSQLSIVR